MQLQWFLKDNPKTQSGLWNMDLMSLMKLRIGGPKTNSLK
jgi:hypothetical protein